MSIGNRVREARKDAGLTQQQLAAKVGFKQSTLSELENGDSAGSGHIATIAAVLGVNALWLQTGKGQKKAAPHTREQFQGTSLAEPIIAQEIAELVSLYGRSSALWRKKIIDLARIAAEQSQDENPPH